MRFLADMGVSYSVVLHLRKQAYDVVHLRDEGLQRLIDADVFARAADERRIVLTFDLDFAELAFNSRVAFPSVVIYRLADQRPNTRSTD